MLVYCYLCGFISGQGHDAADPLYCLLLRHDDQVADLPRAQQVPGGTVETTGSNTVKLWPCKGYIPLLYHMKRKKKLLSSKKSMSKELYFLYLMTGTKKDNLVSV